MNRRETMEEVSKHRYDEMELGKDPLTREMREKCRKIAILAFQDGAEVADKTMIEKACEWLNDLLTNDLPITKTAREDLLNDFRNYLKGE